MKTNLFANAKNITSTLVTEIQNKKLRRSNHISPENIKQTRYESNSSLNNQIPIPNQKQNNYNLLEKRQSNIINTNKDNKRIIINKRGNKILDINNNVYNDLNRKEYYNINNNVHNQSNNNINNSIKNNSNLVNNQIINNIDKNRLNEKNKFNNNGTRKNKKNLQNHSFYFSQYFNKNKKMSDISDSESSYLNRSVKSEPIKKNRTHSNLKKEEEDGKNLVIKMTKLIYAIELDRIYMRNHTLAIEAQTTALKDQTTEMRREHGELISLMSRTMNELNSNIMRLVNKYV